MKLKISFIISLFFCILLFAEEGELLSDATISLIYSSKVEFSPSDDIPQKGRFRLIETNRSITQWKIGSYLNGKSLSILEFMRAIHHTKESTTYPAELIFLTPKRSFTIPLIISKPYYDRFSNILTFDYIEKSREKLRFSLLGKEAQLMIHMDVNRGTYEN
jgi:hypothetical protein